MNKFFVAVSLGLAIIGAPAIAKKPQMTPLELQAIQSREFEVDKSMAFGAVMTVIQDLGYTVNSADVQSGFITASSPTENKTGFFDALSGGRASGNTMMTAFLLPMPSGTTRIRLNFVNTKELSSAYGRDTREDKPILEQGVYSNAWERIDEALFVMGALSEKLPPTTDAATSSETNSSVVETVQSVEDPKAEASPKAEVAPAEEEKPIT